MKKILLVSLSSFLLTACPEQNNDKPVENHLMKVSVVYVQPATLSQTLQLAGTVVAKEDIAIGTALTGLQIQKVNVEVGDVVKEGEVLATLENSSVQSQLLQNEANLKKAQANLALQQAALTEAKSSLKRYQGLIKSNAISRQELEQQDAKTKAAKAQVQASYAEIAQLQAQLSDSRHQSQKTSVIANANGVISQRTAEVGNLTDNTALFHLAKNGELEAEVEATAEELSLLETGLEARLQILEQNIIGKIRLISLQIDANSRTGKLRIEFSNPSKIYIGTPVLAFINLPEMSVNTAVPITAVNFNSDGSAFVMLVNKDDIVEKRSIVLGEVNQGKAEVISGLKQGEKILQKAGALINEGDKVEVVIEKF